MTIQPLVYRRFYKNNVNTFYRTKNNRTPKKSGPTRKLCSQDEFLLVLMKLRLALFNKDLADRFKICFATVSKIIQSWIRAMAKYISSIVYMPEEMQIRENLPERFENKRNVVAIIDCSEIFIETPKNLELQSTTWSEYKHHNTMKFLISVTPSSFINYVSEAYTGRISDKALTNDCNFLDLVPPYSSIMADKGFNLFAECAARRINFIVPSGKRGTSQMTPTEVKKTSSIAKLRILVEQVIRRMKTFRIIAQEVPITLLDHLSDIIMICAGLSNLKDPIMRLQY